MAVMVLAYPGPRWQVHWLRRIWRIVCLDKQKIDEELVESVKPEYGAAKPRIRRMSEETVPEQNFTLSA